MPTSLWRRRDVASWCLYDWANSAFVTTIITVVLPVYFLTLTPAEGGPLTVELGVARFHTNGDALWMYFTALYTLCAGFSAPILGAVADAGGLKRILLGLCVAGAAVLTASLAAVGEGGFLLCGGLFVGAAYLWNCGNLFYDSLLPDVARSEGEMDAVSSAGYALGYAGGGVLLAINLGMITHPEWFGLSDSGAATRVVFLTVAGWWLVFSLPVLLFVRERAVERAGGVGQTVGRGLRQLLQTLRQIRRYRRVVRVLIAFIFYNTGIGTVITVAAVFGRSELGLPAGTLIGCILMIQVVGVPAAFGFIAVARCLGARNAILVGLGVYLGVVVFAYRMDSAAEFWVLGVLVALVQGGTQALSRSLYGSLIPADQAAEFFGFFSIFNKVGSFAGPLSFGLVRDWTGSARSAILFVAVFFLIGGAILASVRVSTESGTRNVL